MDDMTRGALNRGGIADILTVGRQSGEQRRTEIYFHHFDGRYYITGKARPRDWIANLNADPTVFLQLKGEVSAAVPVTVQHVTDPVEKERIIWRCLMESWQRDEEEARSEMPSRVADGMLIELIPG